MINQSVGCKYLIFVDLMASAKTTKITLKNSFLYGSWLTVQFMDSRVKTQYSSYVVTTIMLDQFFEALNGRFVKLAQNSDTSIISKC